MKRVEHEESGIMKGEKEIYRQHVASNFDGMVCDRIYGYFKKEKASE